ncbi:MAG: SDR family NAD(P)-dependent oxidoreductase, partial [Opitutales bacterium]|nr:SDR family NAD(P)-dependent oxidoreductase [Opitutales bacterium]
MLIENKVAVITGAARGVGRATALRLAQAGCHVVINYRSSKEHAQQTAKDIESCGVKALAIQGDICDDRFCRELMKTA